MTTAIVCSSLLAAMVFLLGFNVTIHRAITAKRGGSQAPTDPADHLLIAQRAHGNAAEYVPTLILMFLVGAYLDPSPWTIGLIVAATVSRVLHAVTMLTMDTLDKASVPRLAGAMGTYLFGTALAVTAGMVALA